MKQTAKHDRDAPTILPFTPAKQAMDVAAQEDWVILLHGLFASRRSMHRIESRLLFHGYRVCNWGYSTWLNSTQRHVNRLVPEIVRLQESESVRSINFVTHSMGGILARAALHQGDLAKVKRLVMLSPPNRGSHLTRLPPGPAAWLVPAIADLAKTDDSLPNRLPALPGIEVGVIAATRDIIVRFEDTSLEHQTDHCTVPSTHFRLPQNSDAINLTLSFLQRGRFGLSRRLTG